MTTSELNTLIDQEIYENTTGAITGTVLNSVLKALNTKSIQDTEIVLTTAYSSYDTTLGGRLAADTTFKSALGFVTAGDLSGFVTSGTITGIESRLSALENDIANLINAI